MKITLSLLSINLDLLGGLNLRLAELLKGLVKNGHDVSIIQTQTSYANSTNFIKSMNGRIKPLVINFSMPSGYLYWFALPYMWLVSAKFLPKECPDVLDLWDPLLNLPQRDDISCRTIFSHIIFRPYFIEHLRSCGWRSLGMSIELPFIEEKIKSYKRTVSGFLIENHIQKEYLTTTHHVDENSIALVPPGYDYALINSLRKLDRKREGDRKLLVYSGRIHRWKGINELIDAFYRISLEYKDWDLYLVGDGPDKQNIERKVKLLHLEDRVLFMGQQSYESAMKFVAAGDIFIYPSYIEAFGRSVMEALALGIPTITTDVVGNANHLVEDGYSGVLVPIKNVDLLYLAIKKVIDNPDLRDYLAKNGINKTTGYTIDAMVEKTISFYKH